LPDEFAGLNFKKLMKALDLNGNGLIEKDEFVSLVEEAGMADVDTAQYMKISKAARSSSPGKSRVHKVSENTVKYTDTMRPEDKLTAK
jgi:Ca2+-binding EF-hand superfamily protein